MAEEMTPKDLVTGWYDACLPFLIFTIYGLGIRVAIKPEYRIAPPPALSPQMAEIPRSKFQFDFDFERKILAEAEKDSQNWSSIILENGPPSRTTETSSLVAFLSLDSSIPQDPLASKFLALGLSPEAVSLAVKTYGDNPTKVREFVLSYNRLREMGFAANNVAEVLAKHDNDMEKASLDTEADGCAD
ncbi:hypothetical protein EJ110_NYTH15363 [Nymphaea thermarum]|nr:hypothetical protein EJ110_NYTH15363 [Nymphaea thermarum]